MAKFVSVFISATYRRLIVGVMWLLSLAVVLGLLSIYALHKTSQSMEAQSQIVAEHYVRLRNNLLGTFDAMYGELTAEPCTPAFTEQLRKIAYRPDGLNEFLYAPGGIVKCSANVQSFAKEIDLGSPDIALEGERSLRFWVDQDLKFLDLEDEQGTIVLSGPFATIVPAQTVQIAAPGWMSLQVVITAADGRWWHRNGAKSVYPRLIADREAGRTPLMSGNLETVSCDPNGLHCVANRADLVALAASERILVAIAVAAAAVIAAFIASQANSLITRRWSFESRFRRHLDADSIICMYQPVMEAETGEIIGCEVLARWRDIDDQIVYPDRFVGLVERYGMTRYFTELVARRACAELSAVLPEGRRLQINFNIFPRDLDSNRLRQTFQGFTEQPERFDVVLEIVESDAIPATAQREIEALRRAGIKTYIDDFGTGYSNMQNLAALSVDGVKLDRAFAMAPDNSMMAQMLRHAIDMIHATGRVMVVEGVETAERLQLLRSMQARVDYVQGYFISRPLDAAAFAAFLTPRPTSLNERKREAGLAVVAA